MKVKSLLLSMCAIAALASCSQNDDEITGGSNAPEAKVTIRFAGSGSGVATRVDKTEADGGITTLTAYFFNSSGALIKTPINVLTEAVGGVKPGTDGDKVATLTTTTDATQVILVANAPKGDTYTDVTTTDQLKNKVISSLGAEASSNFPVEQKKDYLTMSGWGAINVDGSNRTASVTLHFTAAKISKINFTFTDPNAQTHYASDETDLTTPANDKWFYIKQAYLMMAQTNSTLMPAGAAADAWTGAFGPTTTGFAYAGAFKWVEAPWQSSDASKQAALNSADYLNQSVPNQVSGVIENVLGDKQFYVFENNTTVPTDATAVVVEARCNIKKDGKTTPESRYFTVYFGEKTASSNFANIKGGQSYEITLKTNGSFDPSKGTGGGGTPDPTKPTVPADVTVTVHPAQWVTNTDIKKEFN